MKINILQIWIFSIAIFLSGCMMAEYDDVSHEKNYSHLIGTVYTTLVPLEIHGVTLDKNYKKQIDVYSVTTAPGFSGPEVITKGILNTQTIFRIIKIIECSNCFFGEKNTKFTIKVLSTNKYKNNKVNLSVYWEDIIITNKNKKVYLNPKLFKEN